MQEHTNREFTQHRVSEVKDTTKQALFPRFASLRDGHYTAVGHVVLGNTRMMFGSMVTTLAREMVGSLLCSCPSSESEKFSLTDRPNHIILGEIDRSYKSLHPIPTQEQWDNTQNILHETFRVGVIWMLVHLVCSFCLSY